ncbi:MAG: adenosyl-hopene transferase HpnH [Nitrospirota bacterium]
MRFPLSLYTSLTRSFIQNARKGIKQFPLVLMLEPTHRCNLDCAGCDRIRLYHQKQTPDLTLEQCLAAVKESGAPVITITGGEPMLYKDLKPLVAELIRMKKHIYVCSNGILTESFIDDMKPSSRLTLNIHLDGLEETHDRIVNKPGTFQKAVASIKKAKKKGFRVSTNTSIFKNSDNHELESLFDFLKGLGVDGILLSPAFSYERVEDDIFLTREEAIQKFKSLNLKKYPLLSSPLYLDFLTGKRDLRCTPWGNPTRNPLGWKSPCYLITDAYHPSYNDMMQQTDWDRYEAGRDPRCKDCMVHSGYEATVQRIAFSNPRDIMRLLLWNMSKS